MPSAAKKSEPEKSSLTSTKSIWEERLHGLFLRPHLVRWESKIGLARGVTVALQILVLSVKVRILTGQQKDCFKIAVFCSFCPIV